MCRNVIYVFCCFRFVDILIRSATEYANWLTNDDTIQINMVQLVIIDLCLNNRGPTETMITETGIAWRYSYL